MVGVSASPPGSWLAPSHQGLLALAGVWIFFPSLQLFFILIRRMGRHVGHMCTSLLTYPLKFLLAVTKCQRNAPSWRRGLFGPMVKGDSLSRWGRYGWRNGSSLWRLPAHIRVDGVTLSQSSSGLLSDTPKGGPYCCLQCSLSSS